MLEHTALHPATQVVQTLSDVMSTPRRADQDIRTPVTTWANSRPRKGELVKVSSDRRAVSGAAGWLQERMGNVGSSNSAKLRSRSKKTGALEAMHLTKGGNDAG